jgi:hypothetical protein
MNGPSQTERDAARIATAEVAKAQLDFFDKRAIEIVVPKELMPQLKKWAKANDCSLKEAIGRLLAIAIAGEKKGKS